MKILGILFFVFLTMPLWGQNDSSPEPYRIRLATPRSLSLESAKIQLDSFEWDKVFIHYLTAKSGEEMDNIMERLYEEDYPFVLIRANALEQLKKTIPLYDDYHEVGEKYRQNTKELEVLHSLEVQQLQVISDLQNQRIKTYKVLSDSLYQDVLAMSKLADEYREQGQKAIRGKNMGKIWSGALGGAIGFLAGIAIFDEKK